MKTFTKLFAATALLASASTATLAQVSAGGALDTAGSVSVNAGSTSVGSSISGDANANGNAGGNSSGALDAAGSAAGGVNASGTLDAASSNASSAVGNLDAAGTVDAATSSNGTGVTGSANGAANSNAGGNSSSNANGGFSAGGNANANANSNAGGNANANGNVNANASADGQLTYGQVISDLRTSSVTADEIEALDEINVTVVTLSELRGNAGENASALDQAVSASGSIVAEVQSENTTYTNLRSAVLDALEDTPYDISNVVGITTSADGQVTVVVDATN